MMTAHTQQDTLETLAGATIQHGPLSQRIYVMHMAQADPALLVPELEALATRQGYTKIFAKVPNACSAAFIAQGYLEEAAIPGFYQGHEAVSFLARYLSEKRTQATDSTTVENVLTLARSKTAGPPPSPLSLDFSIRVCTPNDAVPMSAIYREVFASYPFPIHDPDYLVETMRTHVVYFGVETQGQLIALSSAEMDQKNLNAEMTDFATLPQWRGQGMALYLLESMEKAMRKRGIRVAYTIARAVSPGMNVTFSKGGYQFAGTLINNTNISGGIESMNVWYKPLD